MGHYDDCRYSDEAKKESVTKGQVDSLIKEVQKKGQVVCYDDYDGMRKIYIARQTELLKVTTYTSSYRVIELA